MDTKAALTDREQLCVADVRRKIKITGSNKGTIYILCPADLAKRLYKHFIHKQIESTFPKRAIDGTHPDDEMRLDVTTTLVRATDEVDEFVSNIVRVHPEKLS